MATLEQRFKALERDYPMHSSFVNFGRAVEGQPLSKARVCFYFRRLVKKDDYAKSDFKRLAKHLYAKTLMTPSRNKGFLGEMKRKSGIIAPNRNSAHWASSFA